MKFIENLLKFIRDRLRFDVEAAAKRATCEWCERPDGCCDCQERIGCRMAGEIFHMQCGWCVVCSVPMFMCAGQHWEGRR